MSNPYRPDIGCLACSHVLAIRCAVPSLTTPLHSSASETTKRTVSRPPILPRLCAQNSPSAISAPRVTIIRSLFVWVEPTITRVATSSPELTGVARRPEFVVRAIGQRLHHPSLRFDLRRVATIPIKHLPSAYPGRCEYGFRGCEYQPQRGWSNPDRY